MAIDYNELLNRCCEVEKDALDSPPLNLKPDCVPRFFHVQEVYPYLTHRIADDTVDGPSEDLDEDRITVVIRVVIGSATAGYRGEQESLLYQILPRLKAAFNGNEGLQSEMYPEAMDNVIAARITGHTGLRAFANAGIDGIQVGSELTLVCDISETIEFDQY